MDPNCMNDEGYEKRLYVGNIDHRISEASLINMFSSFGKIESEDLLLHTRGPKRGEPRGFAFIQYSTVEEARRAKDKMHGRLACGRPLVVRLASEKAGFKAGENLSTSSGVVSRSVSSSRSYGQMSRSAKITAIKNKLKVLEDDGSRAKKLKQLES